MNALAIKKYFESQYKKGQRLHVARMGSTSNFFITDGRVVFIQSEDSAVLESRAVFPILPLENQVFTYIDGSYQETGPDILKLWDSIVDKNRNVVSITEWRYGGLELAHISRVFDFKDGRHTFIDEKLVALLISKKVSLNDYSFHAADNQLSPIVANLKDEPVAIIMPIRQEPIYLTVDKKAGLLN